MSSRRMVYRVFALAVLLALARLGFEVEVETSSDAAPTRVASDPGTNAGAPSSLAPSPSPSSAVRRPFLTSDVFPRASQNSFSRRLTETPPRFSFFGFGGGFEASIEFGIDGGQGVGLTQVPEPGERFPIATPEPARDDADDASPIYSNWAKFPVGSWARFRTTSVASENDKTTQSVTETKITLEKVDMTTKSYVLRCESVVKVGDVDYSKRSETIEFDFWDLRRGENATSESLAPVKLIIAGRAVPCRVRRIVRDVDDQRETTTLWYSSVVAPYIIQKQTTREPLRRDSESNATARELYVVQKTAANELFEDAPYSYVALVSAETGRRRSTTTRVVAPGVPGGMTRETVVELPPKDGGKPILYRVDAALLDYYVAK